MTTTAHHRPHSADQPMRHLRPLSADLDQGAPTDGVRTADRLTATGARS